MKRPTVKDLLKGLTKNQRGDLIKISKPLNKRQRDFADNYFELGNATKAAIAAGYAKDRARATGSENVAKRNIRARIEFWNKIVDSYKIADAKEILEFQTSVVRGQAKSKMLTKSGYVDVYPTITERVKAAEDIMKRYPMSDMDKAQIKRAQAEAVKAETEAKLAKQQIKDHDTASGQVMRALQNMPQEELIQMARKLAGEQNAKR